jgi:hypothetical protein
MRLRTLNGKTDYMAIICAFLLGFLGAVLIYLTHRQQRLLSAPLHARVRIAATVTVFASTWLWWHASGAAAGLAGALATLMLAGVALPYLAWWRGKRTVVER